MKLLAITVLVLLSPLAHAESSVDAVLNQVYGSYNKKDQCWITKNNENAPYCMTLDHTAKVNNETGTSYRLYILVTGKCIDDNECGRHVNTGLVGAFVAFIDEEDDGKTDMVYSNARIELGSNGIAPTGWQFVKLSTNDWGWYNSDNFMQMGFTVGSYAILAPYNNSIRNLIPEGFIQNYDDTGTSCGSEDKETCTAIESKLEFDSSQTDDATEFFPIRLTVTGEDKGKVLGATVYTIPFDSKTWTYPMPKNWILKDKI